MQDKYRGRLLVIGLLQDKVTPDFARQFGRIAGINSGDGPIADVLIDCNSEIITARITRQSAEILNLTPGLDVFAVVKSVTFDRANTTRGIIGTQSSLEGTTEMEKVG